MSKRILLMVLVAFCGFAMIGCASSSGEADTPPSSQTSAEDTSDELTSKFPLPSEWPSEVPVPQPMFIISEPEVDWFEFNNERLWEFTIQFASTLSPESALDAYQEALMSQGFEKNIRMPETGSFSGKGWDVSVIAVEDSAVDSPQVKYTILFVSVESQ